MELKNYNQIIVNIFKEVLQKGSNVNYVNGLKKDTLQLVQINNRKEFIMAGLNIDQSSILDKINYHEYGFKNKKEALIMVETDIFKNETKIILTPKHIYELEDFILLPKSNNKKNIAFQLILADAFERVKIKSENIIRVTNQSKFIELFASKNIQMANRIYYDARNELRKQQIVGDKQAIFNLIVLNIHLINLILYLQKMFSSFYNDEKYSRLDLRTQLHDTFNLDVMLEHFDTYPSIKQNIQLPKLDNLKFVWNGQINTLITLFYELMNTSITHGKMLLECKNEDIIELLNSFFEDKNGNPINKTTIEICLKDYRDDKRAKGKKRLDISNYLQ